MESTWVLGFGRFGEIALRRLTAHRPSAAITVVDRLPDRCRAAEALGAAAVCTDAVGFLVEHLGATPPPSWIVPAVPVHVAYRWVRGKLAAEEGRRAVEQRAVPPSCMAFLPHPMPGRSGQIYMSHADFLCSDDCPEPATMCTVTGAARPYDLFEHLAHLDVAGFESLVVRSRQMAPGVGGYAPSALFTLLDRVRRASGPVLLSTACRCHGVMHALAESNSGTGKDT